MRVKLFSYAIALFSLTSISLFSESTAPTPTENDDVSCSTNVDDYHVFLVTATNKSGSKTLNVMMFKTGEMSSPPSVQLIYNVIDFSVENNKEINVAGVTEDADGLPEFIKFSMDLTAEKLASKIEILRPQENGDMLQKMNMNFSECEIVTGGTKIDQ